MATQVQLRRGTTSQHSTFTGAVGEVTVDTDKNVTVVHDGSTPGGHPTASEASLATKLEPGSNVSELTNDAGYITAADLPPGGGGAVDSVNGQTGAVTLGASDVGAATAAQGALADSAVQPGDNVSDLTNDAGYITAAQADVQSVNGQTGTVVLDADDIDDSTTAHKFVTSTQEILINNSIQTGGNVSDLTNDAGFITLAQVPADAVSSVNTQTGAVVLDADDVAEGTTNKYVTSAEKTLIGDAVQPGDNISTLTNDAGYITSASVPVDSVNSQTGAVVLDADDIDDSATTHKFATAAQLTLADNSVQPGDNISSLTNDSNFITSAGAPVQSVAGKTGTVTLVKGDVGLGNVDNTSDLNKPISTATQTALDAKADLVGGKIPTSQIPAVALSDFRGVVASESAMTALNLATTGDWCYRSDIGDPYLLISDPYSTASNWLRVQSSVSVVSVNGQTGTIVLDADDVGALESGDNVSDLLNDAGYITLAQVPADAVSSVNTQTGAVVLDADDIDDSTTTHKFATASQLSLADSSVQPADNVSDLTNDAGYITLAQVPADAVSSVNTQTGAVVLDADDIDDSTTTHKFATASQLSLADSSVQPGDNVSDLTNDANYITSAGAPVQSVNTQTGTVVLDADDIDDAATTHKFATAAQLSNADSATQPGDNVSTLTNDAGYITLAQVPADAVSSVNSQTGVVVLDADDIDDSATTHKFVSQSELNSIASATQPGDGVSTLTNDANYITLAQVPADAVSSVNTQTGAVVLDADDIDDSATIHKFATASQLSNADSAVQPGDNVSDLTNDAGYVTSTTAPVTSVAGKTGAVTLVKGDVGLGSVDNTSDLNKPISTATQTALDAKADLVSGKVPTSQIPAVALSDFRGVVASESAMTALSLATVGDWCYRSDIGDPYLLIADPYSTASNWLRVQSSVSVVSVNGQTGTIVLDADDVGALESGDNVSELTNDAGYITSASVPVDSVNSQTGAVVLDADDIDDTSTTHKFATAAQLANADSALQSSDNVSELTNDAGYITLAQVPADAVSSVNSQTGAVVLDADDIDDSATTHKFATASQLSLADSSVQPGDNISTLTNDSGYLTNITGQNLSDLADVNASSPSNGEFLQWNGSAWVPGATIDNGAF